jgi:peptidyl-prolyl cis-trans isomerase D
MAQAQEDSINVNTAEDIRSTAQTIRGLGDARQVVRWAYNEASLGDVSPVFELEDAYVVAVLTEVTEEGTAELEDVRDELEAKVKAEMKGEQIAEQLKGLSGTLEEIAEAFGPDANVYSSSDLNLGSNTLPNVGFAPKAVGKAFALGEGEVSEPIEGENGVVMIQLEALTEAGEIADYSSYKEQLAQQARQRTTFNISEAIREFAQIEDQRYKFY